MSEIYIICKKQKTHINSIQYIDTIYAYVTYTYTYSYRHIIEEMLMLSTVQIHQTELKVQTVANHNLKMFEDQLVITGHLWQT